MTNIPDVRDWRGRNVVDRDGDKIGKLDEIYLDQETRRPEWALVSTGLLGTKSQFVPLRGADLAGDDVRVAYTKQQVKDAPGIDADGELSHEEEQRLYRHYGLEYAATAPGEEGVRTQETARTSGGDVGTQETARTSGGELGTQETAPRSGRDVAGDDAMTRSEEELRVGTAERERGRARLRKWVETDEVQETVPVRREKARIEREPITDENVDDATRGPDISESEHEVTLMEEEPVVEKRAVPKERVRLEKDVETDEEQVTETVRKEHVEAENGR